MSTTSISISELVSYYADSAYMHYFEDDLSEKASVGGVQLADPTPREALKLSTELTDKRCEQILDQVQQNEICHVYGLATLEEGLIVAYDPDTSYGTHQYMERAESLYVVTDIERGRRGDRVEIQLVCLKTGQKLSISENTQDDPEKYNTHDHDDKEGIASGYFEKLKSEFGRHEEEDIEYLNDLSETFKLPKIGVKKTNQKMTHNKQQKKMYTQTNNFFSDEYNNNYESKSLPIQYIPDEVLIDSLELHSQVVAQKI